jgi:hypothetical protein
MTKVREGNKIAHGAHGVCTERKLIAQFGNCCYNFRVCPIKESGLVDYRCEEHEEENAEWRQQETTQH